MSGGKEHDTWAFPCRIEPIRRRQQATPKRCISKCGRVWFMAFDEVRGGSGLQIEGWSLKAWQSHFGLCASLVSLSFMGETEHVRQ